MTHRADEAADTLERRKFFDEFSARFDELRGDADAWAAIQAERDVEQGALSNSAPWPLWSVETGPAGPPPRAAPPRKLAESCLYRHTEDVNASELVRATRSKSGLTQATLAQRAGTSQAAVARYESGTVSPSVTTLSRLLRAAGQELVLSSRPALASDLSGDRAQRLRLHRTDVLRLARAAGATNVRIFGSVARGEDRPDSDIDLLVDFDVSQGLAPIARLVDQLELLLGEPVDVAPAAMLAPKVAERAMSEAVPL